MTSVTLPKLATSVRERLIADAVAIGSRRRMCRTLLTAEDGVAILNAMPLCDDPRDSYAVVNVINPDNSIRLVNGKYRPVTGREDHPLTGISWDGACVLARSVGARLPSVTEWCDVVSAHRTDYPWGNRPPAPDLANFDEHIGGTTPVTRFPASMLGYHDLLGNAGEWCALRPGDVDEAPVMGGGWNKPISERWREPRLKWRRIGTVAIGMRLLFDIGGAR
jgi:hypothetical protein